MISKVKQNPQQNPYANYVAQTIGVGAGFATQKAVKDMMASSINTPIIYKMISNARALSKNENDTFYKATQTMLQENGLGNEVKINIYTAKDLQDPKIRRRYKKAFELEEKLKKTFKDKKLIDILVASKPKNFKISYMNGTNACYHPSNKTILAAENNILPIPHEAGHAIFNSKNWGKSINMTRYYIRKYGIMNKVVLLGLLTRKHKPEEGKPLTKLQKAENAIHNNLGIIAGATFLPTLTEEICASLFAKKKIKHLLPENLYKLMVKSNRLGFATYAVGALSTIVATTAAVKTKDKVADAIKKYYAKTENE